MTPEQYSLLTETFRASEDVEPASRAAFIEARCASDPIVLSRAREMLRIAQHESRLGFAGGDGERLFVLGRSEPPVPTIVGAFDLAGELGRGATGVVYQATQRSPKRPVAVKVLRHAGLSTRTFRRFEREAEILGRLQHPHIARVYASGVERTPAGETPWIAMELVQGAPITRWARRKEPDRAALIETFAAVCDAVHYAHQRGVIHRDLKPANVLVTDAGEPKVLDFGVARAVGVDPSDAPAETIAGEVLGTLAYMSPEQAAADPDAVDVRCDVYALGAILHELLTGAPPNKTDDLPLAAALDSVRNARRPSLSAADVGGGRAAADLAVVVGAALEPEPARRYVSAGALADDLRRALRQEPVLARAPSMSYQLLLFTRRRRAAVAAATLLAATLVAATAISLSFAAIAAANRDRAEQREAETAQALGIITSALAAAEPGERDTDYTLRRFLDDVAAQLGTRESAANSTNTRAPRVALAANSEANLRAVIGESLIGLGDPHGAAAQLEVAAEIRAETLGPAHPQTLESRLLHAIATMDTGDLTAATNKLEQLLDIALPSLGPEHDTTMDARYYLASVLFKAGDPEASAPVFKDLLEARLQKYGETHEATSATMASYALVLQRIGRAEEALPIAERGAKIDAQLLGPEHPGTLTSRNNIALMHMEAQRYEDAEPILRDVLAIRERTLPPTHRHIAVSRSLLARLLNETGRFEEAAPLAASAHDLLVETLGPGHSYVAVARRIAKAAFDGMGDAERAALYAADTDNN